jgi:large subunit ribosomal protein L29
MNLIEMKEKSVEALVAELMDLRKEQLSLRLQKQAGETAPKTHQYRQVRRQIARLKTVLNQKGTKA